MLLLEKQKEDGKIKKFLRKHLRTINLIGISIQIAGIVYILIALLLLHRGGYADGRQHEPMEATRSAQIH